MLNPQNESTVPAPALFLSQMSAGSGGIRRNNSRTSSSSSGDLVHQESLSTHSTEVDEVASSRVETASLDEVQDKQLKSRKDKLFKAIIAGDIQLVSLEQLCSAGRLALEVERDRRRKMNISTFRHKQAVMLVNMKLS